MADFFSNFGTLLKIDIGGTYTNIKGVFNVAPIGKEQEKLEITHHGQNNTFRQFIPSGIIDPGDHTFDMRFVKADPTQQKLYSLLASGEPGDFQICYPDGVTQEFRAYVTGMTYNEANSEGPDPENITVSLAIFDYTDDAEDITVNLYLDEETENTWLLEWTGELEIVENNGLYYLYYKGPSTPSTYTIALDGANYWLVES